MHYLTFNSTLFHQSTHRVVENSHSHSIYMAHTSTITQIPTCKTYIAMHYKHHATRIIEITHEYLEPKHIPSSTHQDRSTRRTAPFSDSTPSWYLVLLNIEIEMKFKLA